MRKLFLLISVLCSISVWAQKEYSISNKTPYAWAPWAEGEVNVHTNFTNNATNAKDTIFQVEYLDANTPAGWGVGLCTDVVCYSVPLDIPFYAAKGKVIDFKCTLTYGTAPGIGSARFLVYRSGMKNLGDTIIFSGNGPATGIARTAKSISASISPNPVKNDLIITLSDNNISSLSIINLVGKEVMQLDVKAGKTFDVTALPNGIYFLHVTKGEAIFNKKFIVSR